MKGIHVISRLILAAMLLAFAGFCAFGFLASFEPGPQAIFFRVLYPALGVIGLAASAWLLLSIRKRPPANVRP